MRPIPQGQPRQSLRHAVVAVVTACLLVLSAGLASASVYEANDRVTVSRLHTIDDDLAVFSQRLIMDGSVTGDLLAFSYQGNIDGEVNGSVFAFARYFYQAGSVDGSVRFFAQEAEVSGFVGRSVEGFVEKFDLREGAVIGRDATLFGSRMRIEGTVRGNLRISGDRAEVTGTVEGDVRLDCSEAVFSPPAVIQGNVYYTADDSTALTVDPGVTIVGETVWSLPTADDGNNSGALLRNALYEIALMFAALLFGIIVVRLFRPYAWEALIQLKSRTVSSMATGLVGVFALAFCVLILVIALISMLAGTILLGEGGLAAIGGPILVVSILLVPITSFCSVSGAILFYSGKIMAAFLIGGMMTKAGTDIQLMLRAGPLFVGLLLLTVAFAIPYVGILLYLAVTITGGGAIIQGIRKCRAASQGDETSPLANSTAK